MWAIYDVATGRLSQRGGLINGPERRAQRTVSAGEAYAPASDDARGETHYWPGGVETLRPTLPDLPAMSAGVETVVAGYPEGSAVTIASGITGQQAGAGVIGADGELRLTLAAGPWRIVVNTPFPFLAQDVVVEVSE